MKAISIIFVVCFAFALAVPNQQNKTRRWGYRAGGDFLLLREQVVLKPQKNTFLETNVAFPKSGRTNNKTISEVNVIDRFNNWFGANPNLYSGGPGYRFALINLKSQYGQGINATVEIYGK